MEKFDDIKETLMVLPDDEDRLEYVMELGAGLPAIPAGKTGEEIKGCSSRLLVLREFDVAGRAVFYASADSRMVGGLAHILLSAASGKTQSEINATDFVAALSGFGLPIGASRVMGLKSLEKFLKN